MDFTGKRILVLGAGISGVAAGRFLAARGAKVTLTDSRPLAEFAEAAKALAGGGVHLAGGGLLEQGKDISSYDLAIISPGIVPAIPEVQALKKAGVPLWGELELAWRVSQSPYLAITGTNGKTTTTALVGHILSLSGHDNFVGGNIGIPLADAVSSLSPETFVVAEVSSFQLETSSSFAPHVAAVLNLTPDHLNRHGDMAGYAAAKANIFKYQNSNDWAVLNYDDEYCREMAGKVRGSLLFFSRREKLSSGVFLNGQTFVICRGGKSINVIESNSVSLKGGHNIENALAATAICSAAGIPHEEIAAGLKNFKGVEHRQEVVAEIDGVLYVNDSKGTNPDSTRCALLAYDRPQILILGGFDKNVDFSPLVPLIRERVRGVVVLGETEAKITDTLLAGGFTDISHAGKDFPLAVRLAREMARAGDVVMFSPACASWDMFKNFEERGRLFKDLVLGV